MRKFKIGDEVKIIKCYFRTSEHEGKIGKIISINKNDGDCTVRHNNNYKDNCVATKLKLVTPKRPVGRPKKEKLFVSTVPINLTITVGPNMKITVEWSEK